MFSLLYFPPFLFDYYSNEISYERDKFCEDCVSTEYAITLELAQHNYVAGEGGYMTYSSKITYKLKKKLKLICWAKNQGPKLCHFDCLLFPSPISM